LANHCLSRASNLDFLSSCESTSRTPANPTGRSGAPILSAASSLRPGGFFATGGEDQRQTELLADHRPDRGNPPEGVATADDPRPTAQRGGGKHVAQRARRGRAHSTDDRVCRATTARRRDRATRRPPRQPAMSRPRRRRAAPTPRRHDCILDRSRRGGIARQLAVGGQKSERCASIAGAQGMAGPPREPGEKFGSATPILPVDQRRPRPSRGVKEDDADECAVTETREVVPFAARIPASRRRRVPAEVVG